MSVPIQRLIQPQVNSASEFLGTSAGLKFLKELAGPIHFLRSRERLFSPIVTVWVFLLQIFSEDHSCRAAVTRFSAYLASIGEKPCSTATGSYCKARAHCSLPLITSLVHKTAEQARASSPAQWLWKGREVKIVDGTTVFAAPSKANDEAFPPHTTTQRKALGHPMLRVCCIFSLATGVLIDLVTSALRGEETGEASLFRTLMNHLNKRDIVLGDRHYGTYWSFVLLKAIGVDAVFRLHPTRKIGLLKRQKLGKGDWLTIFKKPAQRRYWMSLPEYYQTPEMIQVRLVRVPLIRRGYRSRIIRVSTTLLDHEQYTRADIGELYLQRWNIELDIRSTKRAIGMDFLRSKTPAMVDKEAWVHALAYNLVRLLVIKAAKSRGCSCREISFKAAQQMLEACLAMNNAPTTNAHEDLIRSIALHRVKNRPGRSEPRAIRHYSCKYRVLNVPREVARKLPLETWRR